MRRIVAIASLLIASATTAHAQRAREDSTTRFHILPALGLQVGTPQKVSAALGVVLGEDFVLDGHDHSRNVALFAEPGLGAGRASLAYVSHGYGSFGSGFGVAATAMRTWKDPWQLDPNQTYVGGEILVWPILFVGPRVGLFRNVSSVETSQHWFWSFSFGIGL
ncbi:MAG TPA: hypothetical protein VGM82_21895 [Gemmatimonadaceae bacterium]|jgi:hypothetical protein